MECPTCSHELQEINYCDYCALPVYMADNDVRKNIMDIIERAATNTCCICCDSCLACDAKDLLKKLKGK